MWNSALMVVGLGTRAWRIGPSRLARYGTRAAVFALIAGAIVAASTFLALADLRTAPTWYDQNAVGAAPDWHYRVPVTIAAGNAVNSTVRVNVDFAALLAQMNVSGTFDVNSPRVVRSTGALATTQEFTDSVYAGATDATGNGRGEIRFLLQDAGPAVYYIYFDVTQNGTKPANPQTPINGNFERGATGTATPPGWIAPTKTNAAYDAQVRPNETVTVTTNAAGGAPALPATVNTGGSPNTGQFSYMIGSRSVNEPADGNPAVTFTRTIVVPAANPGTLTLRYRVEGWDSSTNGATQWDFLRIALVGGATTEIVGPTAGNYVTFPYSPNLGTGAASTTTSGYRQYNGWDTSTNGVHRSGMTLAPGSEPWFTRTVSLAAFAGQTITLRFTSRHITPYRTWFHIDDVEWSVSTGTLGTPQGFGANITAPAAGASFVPGQVAPIIAAVDANPTAPSNPVSANVYDGAGALVASGIRLYNDGTHGDAVAGDAVWTNNGSVPADPALVIPPAAPLGAGWTLRVFARDATANTGGAQNGLAHIPGQGAPEVQANFWNIDEVTFSVVAPVLSVTKISSVVSDPFNLGASPKRIPGATVRYCVLFSNTGTGGTNGIVATDVIPPGVDFVPGSMRSGANCNSTNTVEDDNNIGGDENNPIGASYTAGVVTIVRNAALGAGGTMALNFDVVVE